MKVNISENISKIQKELNLNDDATNKLRDISPKTIDSLLRDERKNNSEMVDIMKKLRSSTVSFLKTKKTTISVP